MKLKASVFDAHKNDDKFSYIMEKILWEKDKMLVISIVAIFHHVFKTIFLQGRLNSGLCVKVLIRF